MFIFNFFSNTFLIFNFLRFWLCILLQRLFYYGSEAIEWFILLNYCVNPFDFSLETYLDLVLTQKNRTKLSFMHCEDSARCQSFRAIFLFGLRNFLQFASADENQVPNNRASATQSSWSVWSSWEKLHYVWNPSKSVSLSPEEGQCQPVCPKVFVKCKYFKYTIWKCRRVVWIS